MFYIYAGYVIKSVIWVVCVWLAIFLCRNYHIVFGAVKIENGWCYGYERTVNGTMVTTYCELFIEQKK